MIGKEIRLHRFFSGGENVTIVAVDHGEYMGPIEGLVNLPEAVTKIKDADAILMSPGMVPQCREAFFEKKGPLLIVRVNWSTSYGGVLGYHEGHTVEVCTVAHALALGADCVLASLTLPTGNEERDAQNVKVFTEIAEESNAAGVPLIGELYPPGGEDMKMEQLHRTIYTSSRILAELGADMIKTFYTGERFRDVIESVPIPVLALGARKMPTELDALRLAQNAVLAGSKGVVFGRNVIQARSPQAFLAALKNVVKGYMKPEEAALAYGIG